MEDNYKIALCQKESLVGKEENYARAEKMVAEAAGCGAKIVALPEMWNCPYDHSYFREYAEEENGPSAEFMSGLAAKHHLLLVGGSIPELDGGKVYNTSLIFGGDGSLIGKYRKIHLFDINIKGGVSFRESDTLSPGDDICLIDTGFGKIGIAICYDLRFPGLFRKMALEGAELILAPANFSVPTGAAHWELLIRSRALDNQLYVAACSAARNPESKFNAYGHSCISTPWGEFCGKAATMETIVYGDIGRSYIRRVREDIPIGGQGRPDVYG